MTFQFHDHLRVNKNNTNARAKGRAIPTYASCALPYSENNWNRRTRHGPGGGTAARTSALKLSKRRELVKKESTFYRDSAEFFPIGMVRSRTALVTDASRYGV